MHNDKAQAPKINTVPISLAESAPGVIEDGTICIIRLLGVSEKTSRMGVYYVADAEVVGLKKKKRVLTNLFPGNPISEQLVRSWCLCAGVDISADDNAFLSLRSAKGVLVGARIRIRKDRFFGSEEVSCLMHVDYE